MRLILVNCIFFTLSIPTSAFFIFLLHCTLSSAMLVWKLLVGFWALTSFFFFNQNTFVLGQVSGNVMELCNVDLSTVLPPPYSNITDMKCSPVWNSFVLRHSESQGNVVTIILSAVYTSGWVGVGFSKDGMMVGSSAMVGWLTPKGKAKFSQYYLQGTHRSQVIPDKGELPLTNVPASVVLYGAYIYLAFQMKFDDPITRQPIILALGTKYPGHRFLTRHDDKTSLVFDFSRGSSSSSPSVSPGLGKMKKTHGVLGIMGWGVLIPIGAIVARYFKHKDPHWYYLHIVFQFTGFVVGLAAIIVGQQLYALLQADIPQHRGIGIFVLVLTILQILAFFVRPNKDSKIRRYWNWYHHWMGRMAIFFAAVNVALGIQVGHAGREWKIGQGFLVGITILAVVVLEALLWMRKTEKASQPETFQLDPVAAA